MQNEPAVVEKVRGLLKLRAPEFERGPHTATFTVFNSYRTCFLRIGDRWAMINHRSPSAPHDPYSETMLFNEIGVTTRLDVYPSGFVHSNCQQLAEALTGLGFLSDAECEEFKAWSNREIARANLARATEQARKAGI